MKSADDSMVTRAGWTCEMLSTFRRDADDRLGLPPAAIQHLATCDACKRADRLIANAVELGRLASTSPRPRIPDVGKVLAAVRDRHPGAPTRPLLRPGPMVLAMAVALVVTVGAVSMPWLGSTSSTAPADSAPSASNDDRDEENLGSPIVPRIPSDYEDIETVDAPAVIAQHGIAQVAVDPNSRLLVASWSLSETRLVLGRGQLEAHVERRQPGQRFEIRTEFATVKVIGTRFFVTHRPGRSTRITGIEGLVTVETPDGRFVTKIGRHESVTLNAAGVVAPSIELPEPIPTSFLPQPPAATPASALVVPNSPPVAAVEPPPPVAAALAPPSAAPPVPSMRVADAVQPTPVLREPTRTRSGERSPHRVWESVPSPEQERRPTSDSTPPEVASREPAPSAPADTPATAQTEASPVSAPDSVAPVPTADSKPLTLKEVRWLLAERRDAEAVAALERLARDPAQPRAQVLTLLGDARRLQGRWADARVYYEAVLAIDDQAQALTELASLLDGPLGDPEGAAAVWTRYLERHPNGRHAVTAHRDLAGRAEDVGDATSAEHHWRSYLTKGGQGRARVRAVVAVGRSLLGRGAVDDAIAWYSSFANHDNLNVAEAALVGLMRARLSRGDSAGLRELAQEHARRFAKGTRRAEVQRLLETITK